MNEGTNGVSASFTGWAPAGALSGQVPVPHRLRSIARGREALLRGEAQALIGDSLEAGGSGSGKHVDACQGAAQIHTCK